MPDDKKTLKAKEQFQTVMDKYKTNTQNNTFNALIYGDFGTGKTYMLQNCPKPVYIHSFDPGGTKTLRNKINDPNVPIYADTSFEITEGRDKAQAYYDWDKEFKRLNREGFFENVGTFVIDSITTMSAAILEAASRVNDKNNPIRGLDVMVAQLRDYQVQMAVIEYIVAECTSLPCHFIMTGHIDMKQDEVSGQLVTGPMITGKLAQKIPLLFDEVYVSKTKQTSKGLDYFFLTQNDGYFKARSRLAADYNLARHEEQDIKSILKRCEFPYEDKKV